MGDFYVKNEKIKKDIIETIRLITSLLALTVTIISVIRKFMNWSEESSKN